MDSIVSAALESICARGAAGIRLPDLWPDLRAALSVAALPPSDAVRNSVWRRLLAVPGLRFESSAGPLGPRDPSIQSLEDSETMTLRVVAEENLRDSFVGLYDLKAANTEFPAIQRRALERLAAAGTKGITQSELAKEFGIKGNNIFYVVRNLECQKLIVRQSTIVRAKASGVAGEKGMKNTSIVNTNLLHLYRYAKNTGLNTQQRIEITRPDFLLTLGDADGNSSLGDGASEEYVKDDVHVKDYLPAMAAICDKLEEESGKVLVVSDIKVSLGYRKTSGHRAWRNILARLKDASLVEEVPRKVNNKVVSCLHLLKKFDPKDFQWKTPSGYDGLDSEQIVRPGKRGQITDQFLELPIDHRIYDIVDAEGPKGITIYEVYKRLGLNAKKVYTRIFGMRSRFGLHMEDEIQNRTPLYRVWTLKNYQQYSTNMLHRQPKDLVLFDQSAENIQLDSCTMEDVLHQKITQSDQTGLKAQKNSYLDNEDTEMVSFGTKLRNLAGDLRNSDGVELASAEKVTELAAVSSEETPPIQSPSSTNQSLKRSQHLVSNVVGARREERILKRLQDEKFILTVELYRWLEGLDKDKRTTMDRKTLNRTLNKLQQERLCKCMHIVIPVVTNFSRTRETEVIMHPSVGSLTQELIDQIYERLRDFDIQSRGGSARQKNDKPVTVLTDLKQPINRAEDKPIISEALRTNGYVHAKMVRTKLFHNFLWRYLSSLPNWHIVLSSMKDGYDKNNSHRTRHLFALGAAIKVMPLELFLQIVGSPRVIEGMVDHCKMQTRLLDLPVQEYKNLMDTYATSRLSSIINILFRLKLIQLVREGLPEDANGFPHAVLTHAMELKPFIEEPLPRVLPSSKATSLDLRPRLRHDFLLLDKDAIDSYWDTLEYFYAAADPSTASHAFPGSSVHEVFISRSWTSVRVMTTEQRMELLKRVNDCPNKISVEDSVKIAKELDLTVEQVLRVYYDKRQCRLPNSRILSDHKDQENNIDANNRKPSTRKRKRDRSYKHSQVHTESLESDRSISKIFDANDRNTESLSLILPPTTGRHVSHLQVCANDGHDNTTAEWDPHEENDDSGTYISQNTARRLTSTRRKRFPWNESSDRQLVMQYAKYRATHGAKVNRVVWSSLSDLPALPETCRKRIDFFRSDKSIWNAVMRLCNLLGAQYTMYLSKTGSMQEQNSIDNQENIYKSDSQLSCWYDFEDPTIKLAVDEVLRYKKTAKLEKPVKRIGLGIEKKWLDIAPTPRTNLDAQEHVTLKEQVNVPLDPFDGTPSHSENEGNILATGRKRSSSHYPRRKFPKLLNKRGINIRRQVCESLPVANAIELLKLVFLTACSEPEMQTSLTMTLQLYSESDLFAAFSYLIEKKFVVFGHGSRPFVLSKEFWNSASSSPFPVDSGKRAANFSTWLCKQEKDLIEHGINLTSNLQCGEIFHLFALISSGKFFLSPSLPEEGIGEADEPKTGSFFPGEETGEVDEPKSLKRKCEAWKLSSGKKVKKPKPQGRMDTDFCSRREKGFPGLKVTISKDVSVQCSNPIYSLSYEEKKQDESYSTGNEIDIPSLANKLNIEPAMCNNELPWDAITSYATILSSRFAGMNGVVTPSVEVLKSVYSRIHQAGEQGLDMKEIFKDMDIQGLQLAKVIVDSMEVFQVATKVNAYDSVRVVDSSYRSKYFITTFTDSDRQHNLASYLESRVASYNSAPQEKPDIGHYPQDCISRNLSEWHKVTVLDIPKNSSPIQVGVAATKSKSVPAQGKVVEIDKNSGSVVIRLSQPILPWINGDGSTNTIVYKALARRVLGTVMQNPGILEEGIISQMEVLNPQTCRQLVESMVVDNHISIRMMRQTASSAPPGLLQGIFRSGFKEPASVVRKHYFANPMSTSLL